MNTLNFSENIARLRHEKKITQEQLADFVGVTKASVSKWETGQSMPDILLLPQIAAFFDVTIDELLGYEPQLSREQIRKIYFELAADFAKEPFELVIEECRKLGKQYYSCYPFLYQLCGLYMNHFMLAEKEEKQKEILTLALELCGHIISNCKEISLCNDAIMMQASILLLLGKGQEVIDTLEDILDPCHLTSQSVGVLIQAYQMTGNMEKADSFTQISMYTQLLALVLCATEYLSVHRNDLEGCEETIRRLEKVSNAYDLKHLHPNIIGIFWYKAAIVYCMHGKKEESLRLLQQFVDAISDAFAKHNIVLHGDDYFNKIEVWIEQLAIGGSAPRDVRIIFESALQALAHPVFAILETEEAFIKMRETMKRKGEQL